MIYGSSNVYGFGDWYPLDAGVVSQYGRVIGTQGQTPFSLLLDAYIEDNSASTPGDYHNGNGYYPALCVCNNEACDGTCGAATGQYTGLPNGDASTAKLLNGDSDAYLYGLLIPKYPCLIMARS